MRAASTFLDRRRAVGLMVAAAAASRPAFAAEPFKPPLWVVRKGRGKVYLFGEVVAGGNLGSSPSVVAAFTESTEYWKESAPPASLQDRQALFARFGLSSTPLTDRLGPQDARRLEAVAAAINIPIESLQTYRAWLVAMTISGPLFQKLRLALLQDAGVTEAEKTQKKQVRYEFANYEAMFGYLAAVSAQAEKEYLSWTMDAFEDGGQARRKLVEAWATGDMASLEAEGRAMARDYPAMHSAINTARNKLWVPRIQKMLGDGTVGFIRVGLYHLFGPDSIQLELAKAGLKAEQVG